MVYEEVITPFYQHDAMSVSTWLTLLGGHIMTADDDANDDD
jgi:hypothetical protein